MKTIGINEGFKLKFATGTAKDTNKFYDVLKRNGYKPKVSTVDFLPGIKVKVTPQTIGVAIKLINKTTKSCLK